MTKDFFVHETATVDEGAVVGKGTKIWHYSHIMNGAKIGEGCNLGQNVFVDTGANVGARCKIQNNVSLYHSVLIESDVFLGPSCVFTNVINPRSFIERKEEFKVTQVKHGATVGANATILCGVTLGAYSFIGAGAVVTKDVPDFALIYGNPAKQVGWMCQCGVKLKESMGKIQCSSCSQTYENKEDSLSSV